MALVSVKCQTSTHKQDLKKTTETLDEKSLIWIYMQGLPNFKESTAKSCYSNSHRIRQAPNYWIFHIITQYLYWPEFLQVIFYYCLYTWAVKLIKGVFHLETSICRFRVIRVLFCVSGIFIPEEVDGPRDKWSGDTTTVNVDTFGGHSEHFPEICMFNWWAFLSGGKQNFRSWGYYPQVSDYQDFWTATCEVNGILLSFSLQVICVVHSM